jgi:valyl-tRNA synthetase
MKRFHARVEVVKKLKELGLYVETKDNPMQIPICRYEHRPLLYADLTFL